MDYDFLHIHTNYNLPFAFYFLTFSFASRAKRIKNKPQLNEVMTDAALLKRYKKQIDTLSQKLQVIILF